MIFMKKNIVNWVLLVQRDLRTRSIFCFGTYLYYIVRGKTDRSDLFILCKPQCHWNPLHDIAANQISTKDMILMHFHKVQFYITKSNIKFSLSIRYKSRYSCDFVCMYLLIQMLFCWEVYCCSLTRCVFVLCL